jgi:uncharacterized membrane protein YfcA
MKDILLFLTGIFVGGMNAIAGGGMLVGFPVLLAAGLTPLAASATTSIIVFPGQLTSAFGYRQYLRRIPRRFLWLLLPCVIGGAIGAYLLRHTSSDRFQEMVPSLILFAVILFAFQPLLHFHVRRHLRRRTRLLQPMVLIGCALLPLGIYGGYFGAGLGFIMQAFLSFTNLHDTHQMNALKKIANSAIGITALLCLLNSGLLNWHYGIAMACGNAIGGYCGARLAQKVSNHAIRIVVIAICLVTASYLALRTY